MKRLLTILTAILGLSLPSLFSVPQAKAQYYGYGYAVPAYFSPYGCLVGCGKYYTAASAISLAFDTLDWGLNFHAYNKARDAQVKAYQYQAEVNKWNANAPQRRIDYYNILRVQSFFEDDMDGTSKAKTQAQAKTPQVKSFSTPKSKEKSL